MSLVVRGMVWNGMAWHGMAWHGILWCGEGPASPQSGVRTCGIDRCFQAALIETAGHTEDGPAWSAGLLVCWFVSTVRGRATRHDTTRHDRHGVSTVDRARQGRQQNREENIQHRHSASLRMFSAIREY